MQAEEAKRLNSTASGSATANNQGASSTATTFHFIHTFKERL